MKQKVGEKNGARARVLVVGGTGTLGDATCPELLLRGFDVDVVSLESRQSVTSRLDFIEARADLAFLREFLSGRPRYAAIVDFIHTPDVAELRKRLDVLLAATDQLVFLSSYRVYSDRDPVITERTPQWLDVTDDAEFLEKDVYAIPKSYGERHLRAHSGRNWTIVRPAISFSHYRLDLVTVGAYAILYRTAAGKRVPLPIETRDRIAAVGWAGNIGRQIAALVGNPAALGEDFTLASGETLTWGDVAAAYEELGGCRFEWIPAADYLAVATPGDFDNRQMLYRDRMLDRRMDVTKMLRATGLDASSFVPCRDAVARELAILSARPDLVARFDTPARRALDVKMDDYLGART